jgi:hypothetical protein
VVRGVPPLGFPGIQSVYGVHGQAQGVPRLQRSINPLGVDLSFLILYSLAQLGACEPRATVLDPRRSLARGVSGTVARPRHEHSRSVVKSWLCLSGALVCTRAAGTAAQEEEMLFS